MESPLGLPSHTCHPRRKRSWISRLHKHSARTSKLANQALTRADPRDDAATGSTLKDIITIPSDQMAVINDILFALLKLFAFAN